MVDFNIRSKKKAGNSATSSLSSTRRLTNSLTWGGQPSMQAGAQGTEHQSNQQSQRSQSQSINHQNDQLVISGSQFNNLQSDETEGSRFPSLSEVNLSEQSPPEQERMEFALDRTRINKIKQFQNDVRRWEGIIEVLPFWRIAVNPVNVTSAILSSLIVAGLVYLNFSKIPDEMLFYFSQARSGWLLMDKSLFSLVPVVFFVIQLLLLRLKRSVFNFDRRLSVVMAFTQIFFSLMGIIAILQILSLVLV